MDGVVKGIEISNIKNYFQNPRHEIGLSEEDTLKKLFKSVGNQYMLNLCEDIQTVGLLPNQNIVVVYSVELKTYVVYEGNRRIAAIKLLVDPDSFVFLDKATILKAKKIAQRGPVDAVVNCYVTNEEEAFRIMERIHSGEDQGRGVKSWTSREKDAFKVRRSHETNMAYLIDIWMKKYFQGCDITQTLPYTTIQRIFNTSRVRQELGLDVNDETSFTKERLEIVAAACEWIVLKAKEKNQAVTRIFNKALVIENILIPWIREYRSRKDNPYEELVAATSNGGTNDIISSVNIREKECNERPANSMNQETFDARPVSSKPHGSVSIQKEDLTNGKEPTQQHSEKLAAPKSEGSGGKGNIPYFFQGITYGALDPNDSDTHGVSAICKELKWFSDMKYVESCPIAATFLLRAIIEESIKYYSKKNKILNQQQGTDKRIWEHVKDINQLSKLIDKYIKSLDNYIPDENIKQYFRVLFSNYESTVDPLNWVIHRPSEFQMRADQLLALPQNGLLTVINYMIS